MKVFSREEFSADRKSTLDHAETYLRAATAEATSKWGDAHWYDPLVQRAEELFDRSYHHDSGDKPTDSAVHYRDRLLKDLATSLERTKEPRSYTPETLARYVATATINAATEAAAADDPEDLVLEWVSMHDQNVRHAHRVMDGQRRAQGEPFRYEDHELRYPGDTSAPIELWIGCRCLLRPDLPEKAMVAATSPDKARPAVIVALPHADDPVHQMGPEPSHVTLVYLGDADGSLDQDQLNKEIAQVCSQMRGPMADSVSGRGELGDDKANVLFMNGEHLTGIRNNLLDQPGIADAHSAAQQFPNFTPHLTLGYPGDGDISEDNPDQVSFDRLALWHGDDQTEHPIGASMTAATEPVDAPAVTDSRIPWHGVLAPEGTYSGDKRRFTKGALRNRDLPLRLTWQRASDEGHKGSVVVGSIDKLYRHESGDDSPNELRGSGYFLQNPEADEVVGQAAVFGNLGVSVDLDDSTFEFGEEDEGVTFSDARVCSASVVTIPAFAEALIQLGEAPPGYLGEDAATEAPLAAAVEPEVFVSDKPWDGSASRFTPEQWKSSCILHVCDGEEKSCHKLPIKEPGGELSRAAVHAAAARISQVDAPTSAVGTAKAALKAAYRSLNEEPPSTLADAPQMWMPEDELAVEEMKRGPGWVTNPEATKRIHDYWTVPGKPGYEKIGWGTPGDFERCKVQIGQEIAEKTPEKLRFINQQCAQWQHDAIGVWPGRGEKAALEGESAPALSLVASSGKHAVPKMEWFANPQLSKVTPLTYIQEEGAVRVVGHLAAWNECHLDFPGICVTPPHLYDEGDSYHIGRVVTDQGVIAAGCLTLGGGHADSKLGLVAARAHYDDVTTAVADVRVGEDEFGIWFAGWLRPWVTDRQRYELLASDISGDWRDKGGQLTLIAAHAVNSGGFRIKPETHVKDGMQVALVAAGGVHRETPPPNIINGELTFTTGDVQFISPTTSGSGGDSYFVGGGGGGTFRTFPEMLPDLVKEGIKAYEVEKEARARIEAAAQAAEATPTQRMQKLKGDD